MVAYIVGMIIGAVCLVFPLAYMMHIDSCVLQVLMAESLAVEDFLAHTSYGLAYATAVVGAVVLLASTVLVTITGFLQLKERRLKLQGVPGAAPALPLNEEPPDLTQHDQS